jgi:hypothetical protein
MPAKLKISNEKSAFAKVAEDTPNMDDQVRQAENQHVEFNNRTYELSTQLFELFRDRTLPQNKSDISKKLESKVIQELQNLAIQLNSAESNQPEGMGSTAMDTILFGLIFKMRDRINILEFELDALKKLTSQNTAPKLT